MRTLFFAVAATAMALSSTLPAQAVPTPPPPALQLCTDGYAPPLDLVNTGCRVAGSNDQKADVENAIFEATGTTVSLTLFGKTDEDPSFFGFGSLQNKNGGTVSQLDGAMSGVWSVIDGTLIAYITVKASNSFALYQLSPQASSGTFTTAGLINNGGQQPGVSHISFWLADNGGGDGHEVPEPATLGLLGAGLAGLGLARRRRRA